jgi:hypothetical protein
MINKKVKDIEVDENESLFGIRRKGHFKFLSDKEEIIVENDLIVIAKLA